MSNIEQYREDSDLYIGETKRPPHKRMVKPFPGTEVQSSSSWAYPAFTIVKELEKLPTPNHTKGKDQIILI